MKTLRLILGDQLNSEHSWFREQSDKTTYVLMEIRQETDYVVHHIQKVVAFFASMRNFSQWAQDQGHQLIYLKINDKSNQQSLTKNLAQLIQDHRFEKFEYQLPDEYRLDLQLRKFTSNLNIPSEAYDSQHFMTSREYLSNFYKGKKRMVMEYFYRDMRKKHDLLMRDGQPEGGKWNFDKNNRQKWDGKPIVPAVFKADLDVSELVAEIEKAGIKTIGKLNPTAFEYPVSRQQALKQLHFFTEELLPYFGYYQDAMHTEQYYLFHSRLSFALNSKMLAPLEVVETAIESYRKSAGKIAISQIEGFVRQIIGWREYIRGIYWQNMPEYALKNELENYQKLPEFYWTAKTKMNCLHHSISNSLDNAYAHHIQRLMITGNFALLTQIHPNEVDQWYLGIYIDAIEWVELPNTRGMSQFADGGIVATKPYVSSGAYINKMSNYCKSCHYNNKKRLGEDACPFNSLYWNFLSEKQNYFKDNNRMAMMMNLLKKIPADELSRIKERAYGIIQNPDNY